MFKLLIPFDDLSQAEFLAKAQGIKTALTSEPALTRIPDPWPGTYPSRAALTTAFTEFETALDAAVDGGRTALDTRDMKRAVLTTTLKDLAPYLEAVAKTANDITVLDATGYDIRQPSQPSPNPLTAPELKVRHSTISGIVIAKARRVRGASSYETQYCTGDPAVEANWHYALTTSGSVHIEVTGLTPGQVHYFRVRAIGGNGPGAWSDVASLMVV